MVYTQKTCKVKQKFPDKTFALGVPSCRHTAFQSPQNPLEQQQMAAGTRVKEKDVGRVLAGVVQHPKGNSSIRGSMKPPFTLNRKETVFVCV